MTIFRLYVCIRRTKSQEAQFKLTETLPTEISLRKLCAVPITRKLNKLSYYAAPTIQRSITLSEYTSKAAELLLGHLLHRTKRQPAPLIKGRRGRMYSTREVSGSNLSLETGSPDGVFLWFSSAPPDKVESQIRPWTRPSRNSSTIMY